MKVNLMLSFIWILGLLNFVDSCKNYGTQQGNELDTHYCQSIIGYFTGTLINKKSDRIHNVEFQLKLWADKKHKRIHVYADKWNEQFSNSKSFELNFQYGGNKEWCNILNDECSFSFVKNITNFTVGLKSSEGNNKFHLLHFNNFNNSFGLNNSMGNCTKNQYNLNDDYTPDLSQLTYCVCCGEYEPNKLLGCPNNEWASKKETPTKYTTNPIIHQTTKLPLSENNIWCKSVVGYYNGKFKNNVLPDRFHNLEFQVRLVANDSERRVHIVMDQWNEKKANKRGFRFTINDIEWISMGCAINSPNCSIEYVNKTSDYASFTMVNYYDDTVFYNNYDFLYFPNFNNSFLLANTIGQCTKNQWYDPKDGYKLDTTLYEYCLCCGDQYDPDPSLGCPKNSWA